MACNSAIRKQTARTVISHLLNKRHTKRKRKIVSLNETCWRNFWGEKSREWTTCKARARQKEQQVEGQEGDRSG